MPQDLKTKFFAPVLASDDKLIREMVIDYGPQSDLAGDGERYARSDKK